VSTRLQSISITVFETGTSKLVIHMINGLSKFRYEFLFICGFILTLFLQDSLKEINTFIYHQININLGKQCNKMFLLVIFLHNFGFH
jgi:hypothetical protein